MLPLMTLLSIQHKRRDHSGVVIGKKFIYHQTCFSNNQTLYNKNYEVGQKNFSRNNVKSLKKRRIFLNFPVFCGFKIKDSSVK